jgi:carbonic anhydrase
MTEIDRLLEANTSYASGHVEIPDGRPRRRLAVLTCMDARIGVLAVLGLELGEAIVLRNAGGRVTDDVLRSLALATHVLGVDTVVVMQHTPCGLEGVTDEALRDLTGGPIDFRAIDDHPATLRADIDLLASTSYLAPVTAMAGLLYDLGTGTVTDLVHWQRPGV